MKPIVKGFAEGTAFAPDLECVQNTLTINEPAKSPEEEKGKFEGALAVVYQNLGKMIDDARLRSDEVTAGILSVHQMLLEDESILIEVNQLISNGTSAYLSVVEVFDEWIQTFETMDNEYMKERSTDLKDLKMSLMRVLSGTRVQVKDIDDESLVLFTKELTPSQLAMMDIERLKGVVTEHGGETSHAAIMCKSLNIPMVVGQLPDDVGHANIQVLLDAVKGEVILSPIASEVETFGHKRRTYEKFQMSLTNYSQLSLGANTGQNLQVNIGDLDDLPQVIEASTSGVGLFRTEFLFMKSDQIPTEEQQVGAYTEVLTAFGDKPVTLRTIDIGGDKDLPYLNMPKEDNPFLGYRAIRMCLGTHEEMFRTQLRCILRSSVYGNARIMFPMISNLKELKLSLGILEEEKKKLGSEGVPYDKNIKVGIMIEVPSAALCANSLAKYVDFFSIGTNDLTQYTMASDRMNSKVAHLYSYFEPAVLMLVKQTIQAGKSAGIEVCVCGEMASNPLAIPLLMNMGLGKYSVSPSRANSARYILSKLDTVMKKDEDTQLSQNLMDLTLERDEIIDELNVFMQSVFNEELEWL